MEFTRSTDQEAAFTWFDDNQYSFVTLIEKKIIEFMAQKQKMLGSLPWRGLR